jgi:hypothetical protein
MGMVAELSADHPTEAQVLFGPILYGYTAGDRPRDQTLGGMMHATTDELLCTRNKQAVPFDHMLKINLLIEE